MSALRLLVVDDEPNLLLTLVANLELEGFEVSAAATPAEALEELGRTEFDLLLSDFRMPGMNGLELMRAAQELRPGLPVVLMTAFAVEGPLREALREGAFAVLPKPFEIGHVVGILTRAAGRPSVLVVDDQPEVGETLVAALETCGVRARSVVDGPAALAALGDGEFDACVVDLVMPGVSGAELIEAIHASRPALLIFAVSGYDVPVLIRRVAPYLDGFLPKPLDPPQVAEALGRARAAAGK